MNVTFRRMYLKKRYPLEISRGVIRGSENLFVFVEDQGVVGVGELAGANAPDGETCDTGEAEIGRLIEAGIEGRSISEVWDKARDLGVRPRAQAALDMALWDLLGKLCGQPLWRVFGLSRRSVPTSVTIGINKPEVILERVPEILERTGAKYLKVKLGSPNGIEFDQESYLSILTAVKGFEVGLRVDANGGWDLADAKCMCAWLAERGAEYVEQPLVQGAENQLPELFRDRPLPIYVDESIWLAEDIPALADRVDGVNLKLMKCGGLTEALRIIATARAHGLGTMIGCMGESTLSISAGAALGAAFDHIDLDSQLNLVNDPASGAEMIDGVVTPSNSPGHGAVLTDV
ncbi:MAG: dipeptide epimerase [Lentisphaeria bacterium]|nr:dipeptide epimerase [Lentisphaeria bacterium]